MQLSVFDFMHPQETRGVGLQVRMPCKARPKAVLKAKG